MKQVFKTKKKLLLVAILMIFPYLSMANDVSEDLQLYDYQSDVIGLNFQKFLEKSETEDIDEGLVIEKKNKPKSKQELDVLLGTWIVSHKEGDVTYTNRFELDKVLESDKGIFMAGGKFFFNNVGEGRELKCIKSELSSFVTYYAADFACSSTTTATRVQIINYVLRFSGNIVTNGYVGMGDTINEGFNEVYKKAMRVDGYRQSNNSQYESSYDESIKELIIPLVNYQGSKYRVIFENKGDLVFALKDAQPTVLESPQSEVVYDEKNLELVIPSLIYKKSKFHVVLKGTEGFVFSVKEAKPL
ncbi:MAG: hypothetical protein KAH20_13725 [Methylococcales bacterium]|nr:hypothetical protein [Methylococcales bacterium]